MRGRRRSRRWSGAVVGCALVAATMALPAAAVVRDASSRGATSPFSVGPVPSGYALLTAGIGTGGQDWGDDSFGTDEPFTVLAPPGASATSDRAVVVSSTGYAGYEGGLAQASAGYTSASQRFRLDGREAFFTPASTVGGVARWADLVVARGKDMAVRVTSAHASKQDLIDIERRVRVTRDHARAPQVPNPPSGLRAVGSVDADVVVGLAPLVDEFTTVVPGLPGAHSAAWTAGERRGLTVMTVPGGSKVLDALRALPVLDEGLSAEVRPRRIAGRPGLVIEWNYGEASRRTVVRDSSWGDAVIVSAAFRDVPSEDVLVDLASSVRRVGEQEWNSFVQEATGNSTLSPDPNATELARGRVGEVEWLFQSRPAAELPSQLSSSSGGDTIVADPCLKLSNHHRVCADAASQSAGSDQFSAGPGRASYGMPSFVVITTATGGASVRVQTNGGTATAPLYPLPGGRWAALVFVNGGGLAGCADFGGHPPSGFMRVDVLDATGADTACLGLQPPPR